jgi:hypothetical protein
VNGSNIVHKIVLGMCEMDREATEYWFASNLMWQFTYSNTMAERGEVQGMDRAVTTCCLPLNHGTWNASTRHYIPGNLAHI